MAKQWKTWLHENMKFMNVSTSHREKMCILIKNTLTISAYKWIGIKWRVPCKLQHKTSITVWSNSKGRLNIINKNRSITLTFILKKYFKKKEKCSGRSKGAGPKHPTPSPSSSQSIRSHYVQTVIWLTNKQLIQKHPYTPPVTLTAIVTFATLRFENLTRNSTTQG